MNILPPKKTLWVADKKTTYTSQDYAATPFVMNIMLYGIYIVAWLCALRLVKMFNKTYGFIPIFLAFFIGCCLLFLLDYINILNWEISINKDTGKYILMNNDTTYFEEPSRIIETNNDIYHFGKSRWMLLIDDKKYYRFLKDKQITDIPFSGKNEEDTSDINNLVNSNLIVPKINVLVDCSYYLFTTLITLSAVAIRVNRRLFNDIIPWVLISAIVGVGGIFIFIWERNIQELLLHLAIKKKILITAISFALAACFSFINKLNLRK